MRKYKPATLDSTHDPDCLHTYIIISRGSQPQAATQQNTEPDYIIISRGSQPQAATQQNLYLYYYF